MSKKTSTLGPQKTPLARSHAFPEKFSIAEKSRSKEAISEAAERALEVVEKKLSGLRCEECKGGERAAPCRWYFKRSGLPVDVLGVMQKGPPAWWVPIYLSRLAAVCDACSKAFSASRGVLQDERLARIKAAHARALEEPVRDSKALRLAKMYRRRACRETHPDKRSKLWQLHFLWEQKSRKEKTDG